MNISITLNDQISPGLRKIEADIPSVLDKIIGEIADRYAKHVSSKYLSGQVLKQRTGKLSKSMIQKKVKKGVRTVSSKYNWAGIFETGGYIRAKSKNFLHFWIEGREIFVPEVYIPPRPFMAPSFSDFFGKNTATRIAEEITMREIKKRLGSGN